MRRRSYIQSVGALITGRKLIVNNARAKDSTRTSKAGVEKRVKRLSLRGGVHSAKDILNKNNIEHNIQRHKIPTQGPIRAENEQSNAVSTQGHYDDTASELGLMIFRAYGDRGWWVTATMSLQGRISSYRDASIVDDGFGITYDSSEWSAPEPTEEGVTTWCSTESDGSVSLDYQDFAPEKGLAYDVDLPYWLNGETSLGIQTRLKRAETGLEDIPVKAEYKHTWALTNLPGPADAEASTGIGPVGITMDLENCTILWEDEIAVESGEADTTT